MKINPSIKVVKFSFKLELVLVGWLALIEDCSQIFTI
jgi:hypothetical protein